MAVQAVSLAFVSCILPFIAATSPLFLWHNLKDVNLPVALEGQTTSHDSLLKNYLKPLTSSKSNLLVFLHDKLALDDINQHGQVYSSNSGGEFHHLKHVLETTKSVQLPKVSELPRAVDTLKRQYADRVSEHSELDDGALEKLKEGGRMIVYNLPDDYNKAGALVKAVQDKVLSSNKPYAAIYSGRRGDNKSDALYFGRHLMATTDAPPGAHPLVNTSCIWLYTKNMTLMTSKDNYTLSIPEAKVTHGCNETKGKESKSTEKASFIQLEWTDVKGKAKDALSKVTLRMGYGMSRGYWKVKEMKVEYGSDVAELDNDVMAAPGFSYHCTRPEGYSTNTTVKEKKVSLVFNKIQTEFNTAKKPLEKFSSPEDCQGFFSIASLAGLFCSLVLILILSVGLVLIANINTMDRFDDPKGKTITVHTGD